MNISVSSYTSDLNSLQLRTLGLFAEHESSKEVAEEMQVSEMTVGIILQTVVESLDVKTLYCAVALFKADLIRTRDNS